MKTLKLFLLCLTILISSCTQNQEYKTPKSKLERFSYSIGVNIATTMKEKHDLQEIDPLSIAKGFNDVIYDQKLDIGLLGTDSILNDYFDILYQESQKEEASKALKEGEEYMKENALKERVKTTESGLQYEVLRSGNKGVKAHTNTIVTIHYQASLINGEIYDSTIDKDPITFPMNTKGTIEGVYEGIKLMSSGDQYRFVIPAKLAYRNSSPEGSPIPPGSTLIFVIELVNLQTIEGTQL